MRQYDGHIALITNHKGTHGFRIGVAVKLHWDGEDLIAENEHEGRWVVTPEDFRVISGTTVVNARDLATIYTMVRFSHGTAIETTAILNVIESLLENTTGVEEEDMCGVDGCIGTLRITSDEPCSCHINPPCSACTDAYLQCDICQRTINGYDD